MLSFCQSLVRRQVELAWGKITVPGHDQQPKGAGRLEVLGLHPNANAVATVRLDMDFLHHAAMAVGVGREVLHAQRRVAGMLDGGVGKADLAGLVDEVVALEPVLGDHFKRRVDNLDGIIGDQAGLGPLDEEGSVADGNTLGKHAVGAECRAAVAN